jgi:hypothetical protein
MLVVSAEIDASRNKKKAVEKAVTAVLKRFVVEAEDGKRKMRSGVTAPLRRRAGKLFTHVFEGAPRRSAVSFPCTCHSNWDAAQSRESERERDNSECVGGTWLSSWPP